MHAESKNTVDEVAGNCKETRFLIPY